MQQRKASVAYEPTDEIASEYNWEEGDYVFESLRFTGDSADIVHTAEVWGYLSGNYITFYIDHADGAKESIRRLVPKPTGTPGSEDYLSTVTINLTINDWAVVTGVVEMVDKRATPGAGMPPTGVSVPYLESAYISFGNTLTYDAATAGDSSCSVTLASQNQGDFTEGATLSVVPALENPGSVGSVLKRYARGYCPPADGGLCAGSYEFVFSETNQQDEYPNARAGFKVKVGQEYAGMKAVSYLSYDQLWTGKPIAPKPIVTSGDTTLVEAVDYEVSYMNNISEGVATAVVTGKGSYAGELSITYLIKNNAGAPNPGTPSDPSVPGSSDNPVEDDKLDPDYPGATIARNIRARQRAACRMAGHSYCQAPSYPFSILSRLNAGSFSSDGRCVTDETPPLPPSMITEMSLLWVQWAKQAQTGGGQRCCGVMRNFPMRPQSPTQS